MSEKMFEIATRSKMRFPFKGRISVEDLWDLSVENLDSVFKTLNAQLKLTNEESLLSTKSEHNKELEVQIEIVKYIVSVKMNEAEAKRNAQAKREQKQKLMEIIASKKDADLQAKSTEELQAMLAQLDGDGE